MVCKNCGICGFLRTSWVLITMGSDYYGKSGFLWFVLLHVCAGVLCIFSRLGSCACVLENKTVKSL